MVNPVERDAIQFRVGFPASFLVQKRRFYARFRAFQHLERVVFEDAGAGVGAEVAGAKVAVGV